MNAYPIGKIANWLKAPILTHLEGESEVSELLYDSRRINHPEGSLFIALVTSRNNGHRFIEGLIRQGVKQFLVQETPREELLNEARFIVVPDTLKALQLIARVHRLQFQLPLIGITGSNGKTIVKEWLYETLKDDFKIVRSPKSFNSQIGVPLSVWPIQEKDELAIIEAGISAPGEMPALRAIIQPTLGIFTNIGNAHAENFVSRQQHIEEKMCLFDGSELLICCSDYPEITDAAKAHFIPTLCWGKTEAAQLRVLKEKRSTGKTSIDLNWEDSTFQLHVPFSDDASIENALLVTLTLLHLGIDIVKITQRIAQLHPVEMRLEYRKGVNQCTIINDAWSADPESLKIALEALEQLQQHQQRTLILSDIFETGQEPYQLYPAIAELIQRKGITRFIGVGEQLLAAAPLFSGDKLFFPSTEALLHHLPSIAFRNESILLKGARVFGFERIASALQQKTHETRLEIQLSALVHNLNYYRSQLKPGVKTMAMVKAFSYGSGSFEVANVLQFNGVDYLAVAYADEGIELRQAGIALPILVLSPEIDSFTAMIEHRLEPEIYSFRMLDLFAKAVAARNGFDGQAIRVHIKFDTGMHRLGFEEKDIPQLIEQLKAIPQLETVAAFSHLAASGEEEHAAFTQEQIQRFQKYTAQLEAGLGKPFLRHLLNSAGITHYPEAQFGMVRLGIGLYGIGDKLEQQHLQSVSALKTCISQIREVEASDSVGYSRKGKLQQHSRIATLPIGYADGFLRKLGNGRAFVKIHGQEAPTVGNICMDMCMIDVTHIPEAQEGNTIVIFENASDIFRLAQCLETIPYEVLTGISERVKRIYFQE